MGMTQRGPALCEEYLPYNEIDHGYVVCHGELPCNKEHAKTRDVADRFLQWGYKRGLGGVWALLESGVSPKDIKDHIEKLLFTE